MVSEKKIEIYTSMSYCDYFNVKARGLDKNRENMKACDNYCALTQEETNNIKQELLSKKNIYPVNKNALYINIPFCATRCEFCPYYVAPYSKSKVKEYLKALEKEIVLIKDLEYVKTTSFECLYIGGGTPSVLNVDEIKYLLELIFANFHFSEVRECTFEANAATLTEDKIKALKLYGINRISIGIQTFNDRLLNELGCAHNSKKAMDTIAKVLSNDITLNIDLIFGLIGQSEEDLLEDIKHISEFEEIEHITFFPLRIMANTSLENLLYQQEAINIQKHFDKLLQLDRLINAKMSLLGYERELASVLYHKRNYFQHRYLSTDTRVLGIGAGAGTLIDYGEFRNYNNVDEYIMAMNHSSFGSADGAPLTMNQVYERYILFCIIYFNRSLDNINEIIIDNFEHYFNIPIGALYDKVIEDLKRLRFITLKDDRIVFTNRMIHVLGQVKIGMPSII